MILYFRIGVNSIYVFLNIHHTVNDIFHCMLNKKFNVGYSWLKDFIQKLIYLLTIYYKYH